MYTIPPYIQKSMDHVGKLQRVDEVSIPYRFQCGVCLGQYSRHSGGFQRRQYEHDGGEIIVVHLFREGFFGDITYRQAASLV